MWLVIDIAAGIVVFVFVVVVVIALRNAPGSDRR